MELQTLPQSALEYGKSQRKEILAVLSLVQRQWRRMGPDFDASYNVIEPILLTAAFTAQERIAKGALAYIPDVMDEQSMDIPKTALYVAGAKNFVGTAGDGLPVASLFYESIIKAKTSVGNGFTIPQALDSSGKWLTTATGTMLSDTGRSAEKVAGHARKVKLWVRMLEPPSCGRCVILAGKTSGSSEAFLRHPKCDCRNIPSSENVDDSPLTDPRAYFESLDAESRVKLMGSAANARAMDDGADLNQIINAYRKSGGVRSAQVNGRNMKFTNEGITRRGYAYSQMSKAEYVKAQGEIRRREGGSKRSQSRLKAPRMMPETIYEVAKDQADAKRLLTLYGWI